MHQVNRLLKLLAICVVQTVSKKAKYNNKFRAGVVLYHECCACCKKDGMLDNTTRLNGYMQDFKPDVPISLGEGYEMDKIKYSYYIYNYGMFD